MHVYITRSDLKIGISQGSIVVSSKADGKTVKTYPVGKVDSVSIFGKPSLSTSFLREMMVRGVNVGFYSGDAHYYGRLVNPDLTSASKQKLQAVMTFDKEFCLQIAKKFIKAKISNQLKILRSYQGSLGFNYIELFENSIQSVQNARSIDQIMGYEGTVAKNYFRIIGGILPEEFKFKTRSTRPPLDPFNSMISLGYSMVYRNIIGTIEKHGLNAYYGFMHQDREKHAALASDLMEEWRAIVVDKTVIDLILSGGITKDEFEISSKNGGCYAKKETSRKIITTLTAALIKRQNYLDYDSNNYTFQHALDLQLYRLYQAIERDDVNYYQPVTMLEKSDLSEEEIAMLDEDHNYTGSDATSELDLLDISDYENLGEKALKDAILKKVSDTCKSAVKGELHTTMISSIGRLVTAEFTLDEIKEFINGFCDIWQDNDQQRNGYYYAAEQFIQSRAHEKPLQAPFISQEEVGLKNTTLDELLEENPETEVSLLVHRNVKYARGDKKRVPFSGFEEFEYQLRPIVVDIEDAKRRKSQNLLKSITFGSFELNTRGNKNAISRNVLLLDYDEDVNGLPFSDERMEEALNLAKSITKNVILLESVSSEANKRKFHLLFLVKDLNKEEYTDGFRMLDAKMKSLFGVSSDASCKDIARTMFVGKRFK